MRQSRGRVYQTAFSPVQGARRICTGLADDQQSDQRRRRPAQMGCSGSGGSSFAVPRLATSRSRR
jgi:hypothetical protein